MRLSIIAAVLAVAVAGSIASDCEAAILFSDNFDNRTTGSGDSNGNPGTTGSSDWGISSDGMITYTVGPERAGGRNQVVGNGEGYVFTGGASADLGTLLAQAPDGFSVSFDFDRIVGSPTGRQSGYINFGMGIADPTVASSGSALPAAFGVFFQQDQGANRANAAVRVDNVAVQTADYQDGMDPPDFLDEAEYIPHNVEFTLTPVIAGQYGNGASIDYTVDLDGSLLFAGNFTANGNDLNNFSISANNGAFAASIDNLTFSSVTAVPEPGSVAALGLIGGLAAIRRRRRKR